MPVRYWVVPSANALINQAQMRPVWNSMLRGVRAALQLATTRMPATDFQNKFVAWFSNDPRCYNIVVRNLTIFAAYANNGANSVTIQSHPNNPTARDYAHVWQTVPSATGTRIIYLGPAFNNQPDPWTAGILVHRGVPARQLKTIAHELSHSVIGTNSGRFDTEHYRQAAADLVRTNPEYAAWNADNYGFFIEACS